MKSPAILVVISLICIFGSNQAEAVVVNGSDITGIGCTAAVKTAFTAAGSTHHTIEVTSDHWYRDLAFVYKGFHYVSDFCNECIFESVSDGFSAPTSIFSVNMETNHFYSKCLANGGIREIERYTQDVKYC